MTDLDAVAQLLQDAAATAILPRWRTLRPEQVSAKSSPDDLVTVADTEAEILIAEGLRRIAPGVPVIGEEAVAADPSLLEGRAALDAYWLVDPVDGTSNFVAGSPDFGVMAALVEGGGVTASWIWLPVHEVMASASRGGGAQLDGVRRDTAAQPQRERLSGWITGTALPDDVRAAIRPESADVMHLAPPMSAAIGYVALLRGDTDAALFWRTHPWDHAPGSLLLEESGGAARRLDGAPYGPDVEGKGLLAVRDARTWAPLRELVLGPA